MKRFLHVLRPIVALVCVFGIWGCNDNPTPDEPIETTFEIVNKTVSVTAEGGSASASYKVTNPLQGVTAQATTGADWISGFAANGTAITFTVEANPKDIKRDAKVTVTYGDLNGNFTVVQAAAGGEEPSNKAFEITMAKIEATSAVVSVVPKDKEMTYLFGSISSADLNTFPDDLAFVTEFLIPFHEKEAEKAGISVAELMDMALLTGDETSLAVGGFAAETEYCTFCIGMNNKMEILSDFSKVTFTTTRFPEFDAEISVEVEGATASVLCSPADKTTGWFYGLFEKKGHSIEILQKAAQQAVETMIAQLVMWGGDRASHVKNITKHGDYVESFALTAESDYTAIAFTINEAGYVTSEPVVKEFTTGKPVLSENEITIEYTKVMGRRAEFTVWASVDKDPYTFFTYQNGAEWEAMTDDEIIQHICEIEAERLPSYIRRGDISSWEDQLRTETEYVTYAFGWEGGVVTTPLFKGTCTTTKAEMNSSTFLYEYGSYYNGDEAAAKYPDALASAAGKAVFPTIFKVTGEWYGVWHDIYEGDLTDKTQTQYSDENVYQVLRTGGNNWMGADLIYLLKYNTVYTMCGFIETMDGNYGEIYRQLVGPFTKEGCSPISEFDRPDLVTQAIGAQAKSFETNVPSIFNLDKLMHPNKVKPTTMLPQTKLDTEKSKAQKVQKLQRTAKPTGITLYTVK